MISWHRSAVLPFFQDQVRPHCSGLSAREVVDGSGSPWFARRRPERWVLEPWHARWCWMVENAILTKKKPLSVQSPGLDFQIVHSGDWWVVGLLLLCLILGFSSLRGNWKVRVGKKKQRLSWPTDTTDPRNSDHGMITNSKLPPVALFFASIFRVWNRLISFQISHVFAAATYTTIKTPPQIIIKPMI